MNKLSIQQFCQLETLKSDLHLESGCKYEEKIKDNLRVLEVIDYKGNLLQELILVL
ncbi:MAG: hypothetical protein AAFQ80_05120 [Cyanobacteria bacterium J06621_8]